MNFNFTTNKKNFVHDKKHFVNIEILFEKKKCFYGNYEFNFFPVRLFFFARM